jgi:mRNA interferase RelE/StbE
LKSYGIRFTPEAARLIAKLHPDAKKRIRAAIDNLRENLFKGEELVGEFSGYRSLKPGGYRIVYRVNDKEDHIDVVHVGHRRDIDETLRALLSSANPAR